MRILHYSLGLPPYRSGGLTRYAADLMLAQNADGDIVSLLFPGDYTFWRFPKIKIVKNKSFNGVSVYKINNPSPVSILHGVLNPSDILNNSQKITEQALNQFYNELNSEVFHIHTLMGLPLELVLFLKGKGVKIVFTSHDYYGLCMKVNFINQEGEFCNTPGGAQCALCNSNAPGSLFLRLRNSSYILKYKTRINGKIPNKVSVKKSISKILSPTQDQIASYSNLINYYHQYFELVDCFHFNSTVSKDVYSEYLTPKQSSVLPISHAGIIEARKLKKFDENQIRLGFIGATTVYKGFPMLKKVLCDLNNNGINNWSLQVWGGATGIDADCDKILYKGKYSPDNLKVVYNEMDLLIVPSICKETFSLITLEAISFGVPVLLSENVGAKDIVKGYNSDFIFPPFKDLLYLKLKTILSNSKLLEEYNNKICINKFDYFLDNHMQKIRQLYTKLLT